jgi:hypothetical protein
MTPWVLERVAAQRQRDRLDEARRERLAAPTRAEKAPRGAGGRPVSTLGQLLATRRECTLR